MAKKPVLSRAERSRRALEQARLNANTRKDNSSHPIETADTKPTITVEIIDAKPYKPVELTFNWGGSPESPMMVPVEITPESHPRLAKTLDVANQMARGDENNELNGSVDNALKTAGGENVKDALVAGVRNWHIPQKER